jgi:predicted protein tyrosine phosphatase
MVTHLISIASPAGSPAAVWSNVDPPRGFGKVPRRIRLLFDDIEALDGGVWQARGFVPPSIVDVKRIVKFLMKVPREALVLIHCQAGQSRSAAVGWALAYLWLTAGTPRTRCENAHILAQSVTPAGYAPNELLVAMLQETIDIRETVD